MKLRTVIMAAVGFALLTCACGGGAHVPERALMVSSYEDLVGADVLLDDVRVGSLARWTEHESLGYRWSMRLVSFVLRREYRTPQGVVAFVDLAQLGEGTHRLVVRHPSIADLTATFEYPGDARKGKVWVYCKPPSQIVVVGKGRLSTGDAPAPAAPENPAR